MESRRPAPGGAGDAETRAPVVPRRERLTAWFEEGSVLAAAFSAAFAAAFSAAFSALSFANATAASTAVWNLPMKRCLSFAE